MSEEGDSKRPDQRTAALLKRFRELNDQINATMEPDPPDADAAFSAYFRRFNLAKEGQRLVMQLHDHDIPRRHFDALLESFRDDAREARESMKNAAETIHREEDRRRQDEQTAAAHALARASNDLARAMTGWTKVLAFATIGLFLATVGLIIASVAR